MVEHVKVEYAETTMPINHIAGISTWSQSADYSALGPRQSKSNRKAILKSNLGLTPNNDSYTIRLTVPPLSNERRLELIKIVKPE